MTFKETLAPVYNRGRPPVDFLEDLVAFGRTAPDEIFAPNTAYDIYSLAIAGKIMQPGETNLIVRRAVMLEMMRVHGGLESSWNWDEGVDTTNEASMENLIQQETGIFQVSFNSLYLDPTISLGACVARYIGSFSAPSFINAMKSNHPLALEYYARLVRISIAWAGPLLSLGGHSPMVLEWIRPAAVAEFHALISA
jgi:hypothetical protein